MKVVFGMPFFILNSANLRFTERELVWRANNTAKKLPTTRRLEVIGMIKFAAKALNEEDETFVMHMAATSIRATLNVYISQQA